MSLPGLFITGTDTGVGKTAVAAVIARSLTEQGRRVGVLKPVATGAIRRGDAWHGEDAEALIAAIGGGVPVERVAPILFEPPLAPPVAARECGAILPWPEVRDAVRVAVAWWRQRGVEILIVEGVGGFLCPLAEGATVADLAIELDYPLVIVARRGLGTLNHTLLTVEAARWRGLRIAGIVLNGSEPTTDDRAEATNPLALSRYVPDVAILADIPFQGDLTPHATVPLLFAGIHHVDWSGWARPPRAIPATIEPRSDGPRS